MWVKFIKKCSPPLKLCSKLSTIPVYECEKCVCLRFCGHKLTKSEVGTERYDEDYMKLELSDEVILRAEISARELRLALATQLYSEHRIDHDDACLLAGVLPGVMNRELTERDISVIRYPKLNTRQKSKAG